MKQAIVILLKKDKTIEQIRKKYVPNYQTFKPHITLVYLFEIKDKNRLHIHIRNSIRNIKPYNLSLCGLKKSAKEYYLYLLVDKGKSQTIKLYKKLNRGILSKFENKDMSKYIPHLSIGIFKTKKDIKKAIKEIKKKNIRFETKIDSIYLLTIDKFHSLKKVECFKFS